MQIRTTLDYMHSKSAVNKVTHAQHILTKSESIHETTFKQFRPNKLQHERMCSLAKCRFTISIWLYKEVAGSYECGGYKTDL